MTRIGNFIRTGVGAKVEKRRGRRLPSPAMMVALIALFVALGGSATAALVITGANIKNGTVSGLDLKNGSVTGYDLKNGAVGRDDLKDGSVTGAKVRNGTLTPGKISGIPAARITRGSSNQTIANATPTYVEFDNEVFDTAGLFDPANPQVLKAPIAGLYLVTGSVRWEVDANGTRFAAFEISPSSPSPWVAPDWRNAATDGASTDQEISTLVALEANQTVRLRVHQTSGSPLDLMWRGDPDSNADAPVLTMHWVGPA
jgi:hypothetical protein